MNFADRVQENSSTTGTGPFTLGGASSGGFQTFYPAVPVGSKVSYGAKDSAGAWEVGYGTLAAQITLTRDTVLASSNGNALVNFGAGVVVYLTLPAAHLASSLVNRDDVGFDIVLCAGQSNMVGYGNTASAAIDCADSRVYQFGSYSGDSATYQQIISGADPLKNSDGTAGLGPATAFAKAYVATLPVHRRVLLVPICVGGTSIVGGSPRWNAGNPGGDLYESAISQSNAAIAKAQAHFPNSRFVGGIWLQGETDGDNSVSQATYAGALKAVIAGFRSRITAASNSFFIIAGMSPEAISSHAGYPAINLAHQQVAAEVSRVAFVAGPSGNTQGDNLHYAASGQRILGASLGLAVFGATNSIVVDTTPPTAASASVANASPTIISIAMSEALDPAYVPAASAFTVGGHTVSSVAISGSAINLTVSAAFVNGEAARTVGYTQPGSNAARDTSGNLLATFSGLAITNNVAPAVTYPRLSNPFKMTESGTGPYTYTANAGNYGTAEGDGYMTLQSGVDATLVLQVLTSPQSNVEVMLGMDDSSAQQQYPTISYAVVNHNNGYVPFANGSQGTATNAVNGAANDYMRIQRTGSTLTVAVSKDSGATYTTVASWSGVPTGVQYFHVLPTGAAQFKLPSGSGVS